jgi:uncharacterized protein
MDAVDERYEQLKEAIADLGSVAVAFSSGVDSTLVLWAAHEALGDKAVAYTATSDIYPAYETDAAKAFCEERGIPLVLLPLNPLALDGFADNPYDRCYRCKRMIFTGLIERAHAEGLEQVVDGTNAEDAQHFRPGAKVLEEFGVVSPLKDLGMGKAEIREISRREGLPTWDKPAFACLMTRFGYGEHVELRALRMVEAAERALLEEGFSQLRVRYHAGDVARIEVAPEDFERMFADGRNLRIERSLKDLGFSFVTMDLSGYETGKVEASPEMGQAGSQGGNA